jgi:PAS domain S-box-containing protein
VDSERLATDLAFRALRSAPVGIAVITAPGTISWANPAYFETTGRSPSLLGTDFHDIPETDGTWSREIREAMDLALREGRGTTFPSVRAKYRDRARGVHFDVDVRALERRAGEPPCGMILIRDVTDRVEEHELAVLFHEAFRTSTNAMQLTDVRGIMVDVNPAYERIYGYSRGESLCRKPNLLRGPHIPAQVDEEMWRDLRDPQRGFWSGEILIRDLTGKERPVLLSVTSIRDASGNVTHYLGVEVDLSAQRSWEQLAAHPDRLALVGQLAAGVAHEINTPLANVMLIAESLRRRATDPWVIARLETMTDQIDAAARIVRGLLDFARRDEPHSVEVDLVAVARETVNFLRGKQSAGVEILESYPSGAVPVLGDRGQLMQVFTNLMNNAYDAMGGVGRLRVSVRTNGRRAEFEIIDHGPGIRPEVLAQLFEPFFTTKPEGEGTGLGLAICRGVVQSHHGAITARNVPGAGAGFLVSLPIIERAVAP